MLTVNEKIDKLRELMQQRNIDIYIIPTADYHQSEIPGSSFKARKFMSGFTGSEGTLAVSMDEAWLWVDGRYFLQAEIELQESCIGKMEMGEPGVPGIVQYIEEHLPDGGTVGFDGRVISVRTGEEIACAVEKHGGSIHMNEDLVDIIWTDRPKEGSSTGWLLSDEYTGESSSSKIGRLRRWLEENGCDSCLVTGLDDVAWLTNMRGNDIRRIPFVLAFMIVDLEGGYLFVNSSRLTEELLDDLDKNGIKMQPYDSIYSFLRKSSYRRMLMDTGSVNCMLYSSIPGGTEIEDQKLPLEKWKSVKNNVQLEHIREVNLWDSVAQTKTFHWLKKHVATQKITEADVGRILHRFRSLNDRFISESFKTIAAYGSNSAIIHYTPSKSSCRELKPEGMILIDNGGQYLGGTTDGTRTVVLGHVTDEEKRDYTLVLKGHIRLASAVFPYGCTGRNLDVLARGAMWKLHMDYRHGTGHGIGYLSNVHEGENAFRWRKSDILPDPVLEEGMITSVEPGYYRNGHYGIRLENATAVVEDGVSEYGRFMKLEVLSFIPFDRAAIIADMLDEEELEWLNGYHRSVYEKLSPYLTDEEREWLKQETAPITV